MNRFLIALVLTCLPLSAAGSAATSPPACALPAYHQFDFWLGSWHVTNPAGKTEGDNRVTSEFKGCVLQEHWRGRGGETGSSFNIYDSARKRWHQTWVDSTGGLLVLDGTFSHGRMRLSGDSPQKGKTRTDEIVWTPRPDGSVEQVWRVSLNHGITWKPVFDGIYRKTN